MPQLDLFSTSPKPETSEENEVKKALLLEEKEEVENISKEEILEQSAPEQIQEVSTQEQSSEITTQGSAEVNAIQQTFIVSKEVEEETVAAEMPVVIEEQVAAPQVFETIEEEAPKHDAIIFEAVESEAIADEVEIDEEPTKPEPVEKIETPLIRALRKDGKPMQKRGRKSFREMDAQVDLIEIPPDEILFKKQYYLISEVAGWFKVNTSLLRFWETEFDVLKPRKNRKGDRMFRPEDVKNLELIYHLLREKKYTLDGAKEYIRGHKKKADTQLQLTQSLQKFKSFLLELKANLQ